MKPRPSADFRLALMLLFGAVAVLAITPFTVYRFASGQVAAGVVDVLIQVAIASVVFYAWRSGNLDRAGVLAALAVSSGCVLVSWLSGLAGGLWLYPVLIANFLLARRVAAVIISALAIAAIASGGALDEWSESVSFVVSAGVLCMFAWLFAARSEQQRQGLEWMARRDPLTGASNRRGMRRELEAVVKEARVAGTPVGLAVLDLDKFKQINDRHGHEAGDAVLVGFVEVLRRSTRANDRLFRTGGEEFVLLLPGADVVSLERITRGLCAAVREHVQSNGERVTVSIGATPLLPGDDVSTWVRRADQAMYQAKYDGRDRAVVDTGDAGQA